jgi:hypothetical protein
MKLYALSVAVVSTATHVDRSDATFCLPAPTGGGGGGGGCLIYLCIFTSLHM